MDKALGATVSLGADGYPRDLSQWVPPWNGQGPKPIEMFEQMMFDKTTTGEGYYGRGVTLLINKLPKLALIDLEQACELTDKRLRSASFCYKAIAKWQLHDRSGALRDAVHSSKISTPEQPGHEFLQKVLEQMCSGRFEGDFRKL